MSPYFISALVLTVLYIVCYAVNVTRDLCGEKGTGKTGKEAFDLDLMDVTKESVEASENGIGFNIGNEACDTEAIVTPSAAQDDDTGKKETVAKERLEGLKVKAEARMEEVAPYLSDDFTNGEMCRALISRRRLDNRPCLKWRLIKDKP